MASKKGKKKTKEWPREKDGIGRKSKESKDKHV
jgi:hypothetical protein